MRRFELHRDRDVTGFSGTGIVAEGVEFTDGTAVLRWTSEIKTTVVHDGGMESVETLHGHDGLTRVVYLDDDDDGPARRRRPRRPRPGPDEVATEH